ncbi:hypothetical protein EV126DRAFT_419809 [Verticillium dahliae]|nr:hypothetical protein EV126DRAFT_419809 [Verticillium dahliae]
MPAVDGWLAGSRGTVSHPFSCGATVAPSFAMVGVRANGCCVALARPSNGNLHISPSSSSSLPSLTNTPPVRFIPLRTPSPLCVFTHPGNPSAPLPWTRRTLAVTGRKGEGARERGDAPLRAPPFSLAFNLAQWTRGLITRTWGLHCEPTRCGSGGRDPPVAS